MNLGKAVLFIRESHGITQRTLAEAMGVTVTFLSYVENNRRFFSTEMLARFCRVTGISPDRLYLEAITFERIEKDPEALRAYRILREIIDKEA